MFASNIQNTRATRSTAAALKKSNLENININSGNVLAAKEFNGNEKSAATQARRKVLGEKTNNHDERNAKEAVPSKIAKPRTARTAQKTAVSAQQKTSVSTNTTTATKAKPRTRSQTAAASKKETKPRKSVENEQEDAKENKPPEPKQTDNKTVHVKPTEKKKVESGPKGVKRSSSRSRQDEPEETVKSVKQQKETDVSDTLVETEPDVKKRKTEEWDDFDADEANDPMMVSEYVNEIFDYLRELEVKTMPNPNYIEQHPELAWRMRGILIDWLIEVHNKFKLLPETLFLTVNLMDRFLSLRICSLPKFQLVGIAAMFIAAKYEEVLAPSIHNFTYMADGSYTEEEIQQAERYMLKVLRFDLSTPSPLNFLRRISKADNYDIQVRTLAKYFMEVALIDYRFLSCRPSLIAAASMWLSRKMLNRGEWNANLRHYSGFTEEELQPTVDLMLNYLSKPTKHESFFKKYASKKFMKASIFAKDWISKNYE